MRGGGRAVSGGIFVLGVTLGSCSPPDDLDFFPDGDVNADASGGVGGDAGSGGAPGTGGDSSSGGGGNGGGGGPDVMSPRDPLVQPFSSDSIWNMPLGSGADYEPAGILPAANNPMTANYSIIILRPDAPLVGVYRNSAAWQGGDRCPIEGELFFEVPIPDDYLVPNDRENNSLAALMPDGRTVRQAQPFARCEVGGHGTALVSYPNNDLYGDGIPGATGGSGLSSLGGTLRVGEFRPDSGPITHTLKVSISGENLMDCTDPDDCFRWPALRGDAGAPTDYTGSNPELTMGSLLALAPEVNIDDLGLETQPGRILAETLQTYGAYVANQAGAPVFGMAVEKGPDGNFHEQFEADWGFPFEDDSNKPWTNDVQKIFAELSVVTNNFEDSIGGGGEPIVPLAPELTPPD